MHKNLLLLGWWGWSGVGIVIISIGIVMIVIITGIVIVGIVHVNRAEW